MSFRIDLSLHSPTWRQLRRTYLAGLLIGCCFAALSSFAQSSVFANNSALGGSLASSYNFPLDLGAANNNRMIVCGAEIATSASLAPNMPTIAIAGTNATPITATLSPVNAVDKQSNTSKVATQLFYVMESQLNGAQGQSTVQVTFSSSGPDAGSVVGCSTLYGVKQAEPEVASASYYGSGGDASAAITPTSNGALVIDATAAVFGSSGYSIKPTTGSPNASATDPLYKQTPGYFNVSGSNYQLFGGGSHASVAVGGAQLTFAWSGYKTSDNSSKPPSRHAQSIASFAPAVVQNVYYSLTTSVSPANTGSVTANPSDSQLIAGTPVQLTATAAQGYQFSSWSGDVTGTTNPATVTMSANKNVVANFVQVGQQYSLTTSTSGSGTITVSPNQSQFDAGASVTLTANAASGWVFAGWTGDLTGNSNPANITMNKDMSVGASFVQPGTTTPDFGMYGFAQYVGVTGGAAGPTVIVDNEADLTAQAQSAGPKIILVKGKIVGTNNPATDRIKITSNKSIIGLNASGDTPQAELWGIELAVQPLSTSDPNTTNVIIRNMKISHVLASNNDGDTIHIQNAYNVWIDHCELFNEDPAVQTNVDLYDGLLDATDDSRYITVSWTYFHDHHKGSLVGHSSSDTLDRKMTYHHNYWYNVGSRMPSYRGGTGHVYNSYFSNNLESGVNIRQGAVMKVEGNVFENMPNPIGWFYDSSNTGFWDVRDNQFNSCTGSQPTTSTGSFTPPYSYTLEPSAIVKDEVKRWAGVGKIDPLTNAPVLVSTTTTLRASPTTANAGDTVTLTATVSGGTLTPTGTVSFTDGATQLGTASLNGTGVAVFTTSSLSVGNHTIIASYLGSSDFSVSNSSGVGVVINGAVVPAPVASSQSVTVAVNSSNNAITLTATNTPTSYAVASGPGNGTVNCTGAACTYTPNTDYAGSDSFTFTATNGGGTSDPATVAIIVTAPVAATLTAPSSGTVLSGDSATFTWTAGTLVDHYMLCVGTQPGQTDDYYSGPTTSRNIVVNGIRSTDGNIYVRLYSWIPSLQGWRYEDKVFSYGGPEKATLTSPVSSITGTNATFTWTPGNMVTKYMLFVGTAPATGDDFYSGETTATSLNVTGLRSTDGNIYVRLYSWYENGWHYNDYTFSYTPAVTPVAATLTAPTTITGTTAEFTWTAGTAIAHYMLCVGTQPGGTDNYYSGPTTSTDIVVDGLRTIDGNVYVRLYSWATDHWLLHDYVLPVQ